MAKFISIDIETSGLDPQKHQILEFGAVLEDTNNLLSYEKIPKFNCIIEQKELHGQPIALNMNARIIAILSNYWKAKGAEKERLAMAFNIIPLNDLPRAFLDWLAPYFADDDNSIEELGVYSYDFVINIAGKNYASFDGRFLDKVQGWSTFVKSRSRIIDPAVLYMDWKNDECLPSLGECLKRAGINSEVTHSAVLDAWDVIQVLRGKY